MYLFALHVYLQMTHSYVTINYVSICMLITIKYVFICIACLFANDAFIRDN